MIYATKIKMQLGCRYSQKLEEIDEIYLTGCDRPGYYKKRIVHDYVNEHPNSIKVNIRPYPSLIPAISTSGEEYVRSNPDKYKHDDLLDLPRE